MKAYYIEMAAVFKVFCDENRLLILKMLQEDEKCACILLEELDIVQSTLSHHMKILIESGLITSRKEGKWTYYALCNRGIQKVRDYFDEITYIADEKSDLETSFTP